jgi:hypothetical protein
MAAAPLRVRLFYLIWNTIGLFLIGVISFSIVEWYDHGASWNGVFRAILKHIIYASSAF